MNNDDWMNQQPLTDVQTAIQSQTIQTALEANTSKITDAGFQSYLTGAPIPRFYYTTIDGTYNTGATTNTTWTSANAIDPFAMLVPATGLLTIPIDGWYSLLFGVKTNAVGAAGYVEVGWSTGGVQLASSIAATGAAAGGTVYALNSPFVVPLRAGAALNTFIGNTTGGNFTAASFQIAFISGFWATPYNAYTGGNA